MSTEFVTNEMGQTEYERYRALSISAVAALVIGVMSLPTLVGVLADASAAILIVPLVGTVVGFISLRKLKRQRNELTGHRLAKVGMICSLASLLLGSGISQYRYATEVPEGYQRISFLDLQPVLSKPGLPVSPTALELDGQKIFVKGYVLSDDKSSELRQFVIVPDMMQCCFGGNPKLTDMIQVTIKTDQRVRFSLTRRKFGGTLHVDPRPKDRSGMQGIHYYLDAEYVK